MKPLYDILTEIIVGLSTQSAVFDSHALQDLFIHAAGTKATRGRKFEPIGDHSLIVKEVGLSYLTQWVYWAALLGEVVVFYYTVRVGLYYTLSQQDASSIIQAAVAISFINEIDNMLFDAVASHQLKEVRKIRSETLLVFMYLLYHWISLQIRTIHIYSSLMP